MRETVPTEATRNVSGKFRMLTSDEIATLVDRAIRSFESTIDEGGGKCSVGDLVRLLQLRKEMGGDTTGNVTVRWVEECEKTSSER
jgi:hypothetical protein